MDLEALISKIMEATGKPREEVEKLIEEKQAELSFLVSPEGAAYLVAKEVGAEVEAGSSRLMIKNIVAGMRNVRFIGKVVRISDIVEFEKSDGTKGKVRNIYLADETGRIRLTLWDDEVEIADELEVGDVVRVSGYSRDNQGRAEIRLGRYGSIVKVDEEIDVREERTERRNIRDLREFDRAEVKAAIVQVFETNPILFRCEECGKVVKDKCEEHGSGKPVLFISFVADDGTSPIRCVAFGRSAESILGMTAEEAVELARQEMDKTAPLRSAPLGKEFIFTGRVRYNEIFDRNEFRVFSVSEVDPAKEIERLLGELNG